MNYKQIVDRLDIELKFPGRIKLYYHIQSAPEEFVTYEFVKEENQGPIPGSIPTSIMKEVFAYYQPNRFQCDTMNGSLTFCRAPCRVINTVLGDGSVLTNDVNLDTEIWRYIEFRANEMYQMRNEGKTVGNSRYTRLPQDVISSFGETKQPLQVPPQIQPLQVPPQIQHAPLPQEDKKSFFSNLMGSNSLSFPSIGSSGPSRSFSEMFSLLSSAFPQSSAPISMYYYPGGTSVETASFFHPQPSIVNTFTQGQYDLIPRRQLTDLEKEYISKYKDVENDAAKLPGLEKSTYEIKEKGKLDAVYSGSCQIKNVLCAICLEYLSDTINVLDCDHAFHWKCLENYTKNCNTKCPNCNDPIVLEPVD